MKRNPERVNPFVNREALKGGREAMLGRVRKVLGHGETSPAPEVGPPMLEEKLIRQVAREDAGKVERWMAKAKGNLIVVERVGPEGAAAAVEKCLAKHAVRRVIWNGGEVGAQLHMREPLAGKGREVVAWGAPDCREKAFACDAAVTDCRAGLADTGAILVWSDKGFGRSSTLVVSVHVVLMPESRVVADLVDGLEMVRQAGAEAGHMPSNVVVINGPSKTADIEMNLITGVHGPKYVYVVLVGGM